MDFVSEVFKTFVEWAKTRGRWPFLLLVLAVPALLTIRWWKGLNLRDAVLDDDVWLAVAIIMVLVGVLLFFTLQGARKIRWGTSLVLLIPAIILGGVAVAPPAAPSDGRIVIAVALFTSVDPEDSHDARVITHEVARRLEKEAADHGVNWVVRESPRRVTGRDASERRASALEIAGARHVNAHLIVWGDVLRDGNSLRINANTTLARSLNRDTGDPLAVEITSSEPTSFAFKQEAADRIVSGVAGLIHVALQDYGKAIADLTKSGSDAERFVRGWALYQQALLEQESRETLRKAIAAYDSILDGVTRGETITVEHLWAARINKAAALAALARGSSEMLAQRQREEAIALYRSALGSRERTAWKEDWPKLQHGLGIVLSDLGETTEADSGIALLRAAATAYDSAASSYQDGNHAQQYAAVLNSKAAALNELGRRIESPEGDKQLEEAVAAYRVVLAMSSSKWRRAGTQTNLGAALTDLGRRNEGEAARTRFRQAVAAHREALSVTDSVSSGQRAITSENLAAALSALAETTSGEERRQLLNDAAGQFRAAQRIWATLDWQEPQVELQDSIEAVLGRLEAGREARSSVGS